MLTCLLLGLICALKQNELPNMQVHSVKWLLEWGRKLSCQDIMTHVLPLSPFRNSVHSLSIKNIHKCKIYELFLSVSSFLRWYHVTYVTLHLAVLFNVFLETLYPHKQNPGPPARNQLQVSSCKSCNGECLFHIQLRHGCIWMSVILLLGTVLSQPHVSPGFPTPQSPGELLSTRDWACSAVSAGLCLHLLYSCL